LRLGTLLAELSDGRCRRVDVRYAGPVAGALRPLAAAAVEGFLRPTVEPPINVVNALALAAERGIEVGRVRIGEVRDYTNYVELRGYLGSDGILGTEIVVGGALLGDRQHPRIVRIGDFHVDTVPRGTLLLIRNRDVPGVIGEVGSRLGSAGVNIAEYHQSRREAGGDALGVVTLDGAVTRELLDTLRGLPAVESVRQVSFD
ncbi:MAG: ACT domain-containing protein, partial [Gemmatimonadota bacterium]